MKRGNANTLCPCGSGQSYDSCCGDYLESQLTPATAQALMRSRYTAFVRMDPEYLLATWHPSTRPSRLDLEGEEPVTWRGLRIVGSRGGEADDTMGEVEFIAYFQKGRDEFCMGERSRFAREQGRWLYIDGVTIPCGSASEKTSRNEPCPCGSGKKFKRCCGHSRGR